MTGNESPPEKRPMGSLEAEVLRVLWTRGEAMTPGEVHDEMWAKELVSRERSGRAFAYTPTVSEAEHAAQKMRKTLAGVSDRHAALSRFVRGLSKKDAAALRRVLADPNLK
jgi:predicted transcriptional regulator